ncbi:T9SS type A sorting domain-containing protein [Dyadobacter luticola]|uniref:T9SS type A sorting domain-containing protein n=1 Tax=Dyadobacter luticola TaxID=1979387 RepID=UPI001E650A6D|nr:T9SS type A sorting domain-containing protein [Dyadobacter luticola]
MNIRNTLSKYVPQTGLRSILSLHGVNDQDTDGDGFKFRNLKVIEKTRQESNYQQLAWMIALDCYNNGINQSITSGQESLIATVPDVFRGGNLNLIDNSGRYDGLHFNEQGQQKAAELWRDAILDPATNFTQNAKSLMATPPPLPSPPLPVTLVSFYGKSIENKKTELRWVTSVEENNDYFEIEKSTDAIHFDAIGTSKGRGDSNENVDYIYMDEAPNLGITYYRLKQVDYDGKTTTSRIIALRSDTNSNDFVYPNPAEHHLEITTDDGSTVEEITLLDLSGQQVLQKSKASQIEISSLKEGEYLIRVRLSNGQLIRKKITKI